MGRSLVACELDVGKPRPPNAQTVQALAQVSGLGPRKTSPSIDSLSCFVAIAHSLWVKRGDHPLTASEGTPSLAVAT